MVVAPVTEMIESVLKRARDLNDDGEALIVLLTGDENELAVLSWSGPFELDDVEAHVDEEFIAGAAIVFREGGRVTVYESQRRT